MPAIRGTRRTLLSGNETGALLTMQRTDGSLLIYDMQEPTGDVSIAWNKAVTLGRNVVINGDFATDSDWTKGDGWTIADNKASSDGSQGATSSLFQDSPIVNSVSYEVTFTVSGRSAGGVQARLGGGTAGTLRETDGTFVETIVAGSAHSLSSINANSSFIGDIDNVTVKQTNIAASSEFPGAEELSQAGTGVMDKDNYFAGSSAVLTNPSTGILRVAHGGGADPSAVQTILTVGKRYKITGECRSDGTGIPRIQINTLVFNGTTSTDWQTINVEGVAVSANLLINTKIAVAGYTEWRNLSVRLANPLNGDDTGTTPGVAGNGRGVQYVKSSDAVTTLIDFYSAEVNSMISWETGSMIMVASADTWAAGIDYLVNMAVDADNGVSIRRDGTDLIVSYEAGGTEESITIASGSPTGLFGIGLTWDTAGGGAVKGLYQGAQSGATQTIANTLIGNLASTLCTIFSLNTTPGNVWAGDGAYLDIRAEVISVAEFANICRSWGVS